jgi:hypothetical protein
MANNKHPYERVTPDELLAEITKGAPETEQEEVRQLHRSLEEKWVPLKERYNMARWLAKGLLWLFAFIIAWSGVLMMTLLVASAMSPNIGDKQISLVTSFVKELLPFIATPFGVALGFYFREAQPS